MPRVSPQNRAPATIALLLVPLACLCLGACGSSGGGSSSSAANNASTHTTTEAMSSTSTSPATTPTPTSTTPSSTTTTGTTSTSSEPAITSPRQFELVYECMRHNGIGLPPLKQFRNHEQQVKINTNTPQYRSTLAKCRHEVLG